MEKLDGDRLAVFNVPMIRSKLSITGGGGSIVFNAGTTSGNLSAISFADSNGISFGLNAGTMTASVAPGAGAGTGFTSTSTAGANVAGTLGAGGLSMGIPAYLTTAMASNAGSNFVAATAGFFGTNATGTIASNGISVSVAPPAGGGAGTGFTTTTTAGTAIVGTLDTNGLSMGVPAYLTAATAGGAGTGFSTSSTAGSDIVGTLNSNGLAMGVPAYLTTAALSQDSSKYAGTNGAITGGSITVNTSGVSVALPAYLTTAALSDDTSKYAGVGESTSTVAGTALGLTVDTNGVQIAYPNWLTTAMASNAATISAMKISAGTLSSNRSDLTFGDGNGVTFGLETNGIITASVLPPATGTAGVQSLNASTGALSISGSGLNSVSNNNSTIIVSARSESLNEIQNPASDAFFLMNTRQLQFQWGSNLTNFSTTASRGGLFEIDVVGGTGLGTLTLPIDVVHIHQSVGDPVLHLLHVEADGTNATGMHMEVSGPVAIELNRPISYSGGSVPMILGTSQSNSVGNLNAHYLQGRLSSDMAGVGETTTTQAGTALGLTVDTAGVNIAYPVWLTTAALSADSSKYAGTGFTTASTAGSDLVGTLATNGISMGVPKWLTAAGAGGATASYWYNIDNFANINLGGTGLLSTSGSSLYVQPFFLPFNISASFIRFWMSWNWLQAATAGTTQANASFSARKFQTYAVVIYTQGTGASSRSIQYLTSSSAGLTGELIYTAGATGSNYTISNNITYPMSGFNTHVFAANFATTSASIVATNLTNFNNGRFFDVPFAVSLSPGNYWMALGASSSSTTNSSNISFLATRSIAHTMAAATQTNLQFSVLGSNSVEPLQLGGGMWSTNLSLISTSSIGLDSVNTVAAHSQLPFAFVRQA